MKKIYQIEILLAVFIVFMVIFAFMYKYVGNISFSDALYISSAFQTFTGTVLVENNNKLKNISTAQMIISYIFVTIILYTIIN